MKHFVSRLFAALVCVLFGLPAAQAQSRDARSEFDGVFYSKENGITLHLSLQRDTIVVPGYEFLGPMGGYMTGDRSACLYGTWMLVSQKVEGHRAELRFSNDVGSDSQTILFEALRGDSVYSYRTAGGNVVKKALGHKLHKIADKMIFRRK